MSFHTKTPRKYGYCAVCNRFGQVTAAGYMFKHKCNPPEPPTPTVEARNDR